MFASSDQAAWNNMNDIWNLPLEYPIEVKPDSRLSTLRDVAGFILALPASLQREEAWRAAADALCDAVKSHDAAAATVAVQMALILSGHDGHRSALIEAEDARLFKRAS
jgi:hypothetical protein